MRSFLSADFPTISRLWIATYSSRGSSGNSLVFRVSFISYTSQQSILLCIKLKKRFMFFFFSSSNANCFIEIAIKSGFQSALCALSSTYVPCDCAFTHRGSWCRELRGTAGVCGAPGPSDREQRGHGGPRASTDGPRASTVHHVLLGPFYGADLQLWSLLDSYSSPQTSKSNRALLFPCIYICVGNVCI